MLRTLGALFAAITLTRATFDTCPQPPGSSNIPIAQSLTTQVINFANSKWIWTPEESPSTHSAPAGQRVFRKTFTAIDGRYPVCATIITAVDNVLDIYVNGVLVNSGQGFTRAIVTTAALNWNTPNLFAFIANNFAPSPAGVIGTIMITYSDGENDFLVTDSSWKTFIGSVPSGATDPSTDDSTWPTSIVQATDGSVSFWPKVTLPSALGGTFQASNWIWTNEGNPRTSAVGRSRAFRKSIDSGGHRCGQCAQIIISTDNFYTLYLNGQAIGVGDDWTQVGWYIVTGLNGLSELFAVNGTNRLSGSPAGMISSIQIAYNDGTANTTQTDATWKALPSAVLPSGFELPTFDDSAWPNAVVEGKYGVSPWNSIAVPLA